MSVSFVPVPLANRWNSHRFIPAHSFRMLFPLLTSPISLPLILTCDSNDRSSCTMFMRSSPIRLPVLLLLLSLLCSSWCGALEIDHVSGCPRSDARFTYDCTAGTTVTITSLGDGFHDWAATATSWHMTVDQQPCTNATVLNDQQAACTLPPLPTPSNDPTAAHELDLVWMTNTSVGLTSTNVFYAVDGGGGNGGGGGAGGVLGMSVVVTVAVFVGGSVVALLLLGLLLWVCRGKLNRLRQRSERSAGEESESYSSLS